MEEMDVEGGVPVHRFNQSLPPCYASNVSAEGDRMLASIIDVFSSFKIDGGDTKRLLRACTNLSKFTELKYHLGDEERFLLVTKLFDLAFPPAGSQTLKGRCATKVIYSLSILMDKKRGVLSLSGRLALPWRPVYDDTVASTLRGYPQGSRSNERAKLHALLPFIHLARNYWVAGADREIWDEVKGALHEVQTQDAFLALFILVRFLPTATSLYEELLPEWFSLWAQVDHCSAWDGAWLTLLVRARKHVRPGFDWGPFLSDIYTMARTCVHTPVSVGEAGSAPLPEGRQVAYQYRSLSVSSSSGAILGKLGKLLVYLLGKGAEGKRVVDEMNVAVIPVADGVGGGSYGNGCYGSETTAVHKESRQVSVGALRLIALLRALRTYFHPSNAGRWSGKLGVLLLSVCRSLSKRIGEESVIREAKAETRPRPEDMPVGSPELTKDDATVVVGAILPLVHEMVYSKDPAAGSLAQYCLAVLSSISPRTVAAGFPRLVLNALDPVASVNHAHQAPAAIRALVAVFRLLMYPRPYLAPYLPDLLAYSLPGVDPNDQYKTTVTLELCRTVLSWIPVQGSPMTYKRDLSAWQPPKLEWLDAGGLSREKEAEEADLLYASVEALHRVMIDWALALLDRVLELLRHKVHPSKAKAGDIGQDPMDTAGAIAGLGGVGDPGATGAARGWGRGSEGSITGGGSFHLRSMGSLTQQLFEQMDGEAFRLASSRVLVFVMEKARLEAEKDCALLVASCARAHPRATADTFLPALCEGLLGGGGGRGGSGASPVLWRWRLRLLSGLAREARGALVPHGEVLKRTIQGGLAHKNKGTRKAARKVLKKALLGLLELCPAESRSLPPRRWEEAHEALEWRRLCEPLPRGELAIAWIEPERPGLRLAAQLVEEFLVHPMGLLLQGLQEEDPSRLVLLSSPSDPAVEPGAARGDGGDSKKPDLWRENLKTIEYAMRGAITLLADRGTLGPDKGEEGEGGGGGKGGEAVLRDDAYFSVGSCLLSRLRGGEEGSHEDDGRLHGLIVGLREDLLSFLRRALEAFAMGQGQGLALPAVAANVKVTKLLVGLAARVCARSPLKDSTIRARSRGLHFYKSIRAIDLLLVRAKAERKLLLSAATRGRDPSAIMRARQSLEVGSLALPATRHHAINRAALQHLKRLSFAAKAMGNAIVGDAAAAAPRAAWPGARATLGRYEGVFRGLVALSFSEYAMVRAAAQDGVEELSVVFPGFLYGVIPELIGCLTPEGGGMEGGKREGNGGHAVPPPHLQGQGWGGVGGGAKHRRITGGMYLLYLRRSLRHISGSWPLLRALLLALCRSQDALASLPGDKQERAAARVQILFTAYISHWKANSIMGEKDQREYEQLTHGLLQHLGASRSPAALPGDRAPQEDPEAGKPHAQDRSGNGGWRYQLMASWCLMHLIHTPVSHHSPHSFPQPPPPPPPLPSAPTLTPALAPKPALEPVPPVAVWNWFGSCLSEGDGQPLQRLALGALARLLVAPGSPGGGIGAEVSSVLSAPGFLRALFVALGHNHAQQATEGGGAAGREQWSLGVKEVLADVGRGDRGLLFPRQRFTTRSRLFWARNARLVQSLLLALAPGWGGVTVSTAAATLLQGVASAKPTAAHEDKRSFDCAAAEVGAGLAAATVAIAAGGGGGEEEEEGRRLTELALEFFKGELEGISLEGGLDW